MAYEPLHHKYRPQTFSDLVGQETIALTLSNALTQDRIAPAYLFTGPRGTGKTSSARILAKSLNCLAVERPTPYPCGKCEVCLAIAKGSALDVMEIDAASNTGVDNIREIIERSRFAPVQCRYKIYAIDECLTGESLIQTDRGSMRIDNPNLKGKKVLSYNENTNKWEYKKVLRWLERGTKKTLAIKTGSFQISCTKNHLLRTETGWIKAGNVKEGMRILSPANVGVVLPSINKVLTADKGDLPEDISLKGTNTEKNPTISTKYFSKQKQYSLNANVDVKKKLIFPTFFSKKEEKLKVSNYIGTGIQTKRVMEYGIREARPESPYRRHITTSKREQNLVENSCQTYNNIQSFQWHTGLERVKSVSHAGYEKVYDLEVEDNHNFVANGLLVHNCHMLSTAAFNALLKTLEEPPPQVVFILATTDPQRVLSTIISRCQRFDYRRIPLTEMTVHLRYIADLESVAISDDALTLIAQISNGGLRDAESLLDQLSLLPETITVEKVWDLVGAVPEQDLLNLLQAIRGNNSLAVLQQCRSLLDRGREPLVVLQNLASFYLNLLIAKTAPQHAELTAVTEICWQQLCTEANNWQTGSILKGQQNLKEAENQLKRTTQPRLWLEVTLLGLLPEVHAEIQSAIAVPDKIVNPIPAEPVPVPVSPAVNSPTNVVEPQAITPTVKNISPKNPTALSSTPAPSVPSQSISEPSTPTQSVAQNPVFEPVATKLPAEANPELIASNSQDPVANKQIWSKVVSCLQPPTTQALLKQQCHLVNFDGSSAIVGVSSAKLQKMTQQKIPNIEAAFARVCQQKVRVQLEVASAKKKLTDSSTQSVDRTIGKQPDRLPQSPLSPPTPPVQNFSNHSQHLAEKVISSNDNGSQVRVSLPPSQVATNDYSNGNGLPIDGSQATTMPNSAAITPPVSTEIAREQNRVSPNLDEAEVIESDYANSELQQAIDNLTQSFEGEVVQLDDSLEEIEDPEEPETSSPSALPLPEPKLLTFSERPDLEEYDDDW